MFGTVELVAAGAIGQANRGLGTGGSAGRRGFGWRNIAPPPGPRKAKSRYSPGVSIGSAAAHWTWAPFGRWSPAPF